MRSESFTLRVPTSWRRRVDSASVQTWLQDYFQHRVSLPEDPGAGEAYLRLSLPKRAVKVFAAAVDESTSAALRRLISARLPALPTARPLRVLPPPVNRSPLVLAASRSNPVAVQRVLDAEIVEGLASRPIALTEWPTRLRRMVREEDRSLAPFQTVTREEYLQALVRHPSIDPGYAQAVQVQVQQECYERTQADPPSSPGRIILAAVLIGLVIYLKPWQWFQQSGLAELPAPPPLASAFHEWVPR